MMAGTAMQPPAAAATGQFVSASSANSFRVFAVAQRLALHVQPGFDSNPAEFFGLCLSLARGIDFAVANNESLPRAHELPILLRQVCQRKKDVFLQAPLMVLMASVKNACTVGWFEEKEAQELFTLANELAQFFCTPTDVSTATNDSLSVIPTIMSRFFPLMKMGQILVSLEVKPGYGTYMIDFHISKTIRNSPEDKIRLLVAQTDNTETSACIITPQDVNFLLNGKGVERRTNVFMDTGPQIPTNVTGMLKYGTNLLQVIGQFKGHYIFVVAFTSVGLLPESPVLNDYIQYSAAELDPDSDIIEGPSRISLNCPISYTRIRTPAKGHSCKHLQCFDFSNFVDINTRRPSWRCPHCNQHVCYTDIRIDQNMAKVLKEVGENVIDVIISADGSWKAVSESADKADQSLESALHAERGTPELPESTTSTSALPMVVDLTGNDDEMDAVGTSDVEDRKPSLVTLQSQPVDPNPSQPNDANLPVQNRSTQLAEDFWSSCYQSAISSVTPNAQMMTGISDLTPTSFMTGPVITDAVSPALNRDVAVLGNTTHSSVTQNQFSVPNNIQLQQSQFVNSVVNNEYGTLPHIPRHISRNPVAVQALPAGPQTPTPQQRPRTNLNPAISNGTSLSSQATLPMIPIGNGLNSVSTNMERQQQFSRSHNMAPASLQHHSTTQNWNPQGHSLMHGQSVQHIASEFLSSYRAPSQTLLQQQTLLMPQSRSQSPSIVRSPSPLAPSQTQQGVAQVGVGNSAGTFSATWRGVRQPPSVPVQIQTSRAGVSPPSVPVQIQTSRAGVSYPASGHGIRTPAVGLRTNVGGALPAVSGSDSLADLPSEQNWRPTGRMRGSLSGRAYSAALNQFMSQPTQSAQAARPPSSTSSPSIPPHLQALLARTAQVHQAQNSPVTGSAISSGSSRTQP